MDKIYVVYWSQSGNTQAMAEAIGRGITAAGKEAVVQFVSEASIDDLKNASVYALGCPAMGAEVLEECEMEPFVSDLEGYQSDATGKKEITIGTCGSAEIWKVVQKVLDDENSGLYIKPVVFDAYNLPNEALDSGEIDLNSFQHKAYLQSEIDSQGYDIVAIGDTSSAPLTLYSKKVSSLDELKELAGPKEN